MGNILLNILSLGLKPLYEKNMSYYKIVKEFREKLPRQQNQARNLTEEEVQKHPFLHDSFKYFTVIDTSNHKTNVSESEIDLFYNKINDFNYAFIFFKKHYKDYTRNLNRFNPKAENKNFDLVIVQRLLKDDPLNPINPVDVFIMHLKWNYKLTSKIYIFFKFGKEKRRNQ
jgi:hypothetical protein